MNHQITSTNPDHGWRIEQPRNQGIGLFLSMLIVLFLLSGCSGEQRAEDMDQFFQTHQNELLQLREQLHGLMTVSPVRGLNTEQETVILDGTDTASWDDAQQQFPQLQKRLQRAWELRRELGLRKSYFMEDGSFWVIMDEADILGNDFGYVLEGEVPISSYRILNYARPVVQAKGWFLVRF